MKILLEFRDGGEQTIAGQLIEGMMQEWARLNAAALESVLERMPEADEMSQPEAFALSVRCGARLLLTKSEDPGKVAFVTEPCTIERLPDGSGYRVETQWGSGTLRRGPAR